MQFCVLILDPNIVFFSLLVTSLFAICQHNSARVGAAAQGEAGAGWWDARAELYLQRPSQMRCHETLPGFALSVLEYMDLFADDCQGWWHPKASLSLPNTPPSPHGPRVPLPASQGCQFLLPVSSSTQRYPAWPQALTSWAHLWAGLWPGVACPCPRGDAPCLGVGLSLMPTSFPAPGRRWDKPCPPGPGDTFLPIHRSRTARFLLLRIWGHQRGMASLLLSAWMTNCTRNKVCC